MNCYFKPCMIERFPYKLKFSCGKIGNEQNFKIDERSSSSVLRKNNF